MSEAPPQGPERGPQPGCGASPIKPQQGDVLGVEGREENECSQSHLVASRTYHLTLSSHLPAAGRGPRVVQWLSGVRLFAIPWTAAHQASLSITNSRSLLKLMSIELVMPSNHLILCCPLLLPLIFPRIRIFSSDSVLRIRWPKYWEFQLPYQSFQ